MKVNLIVTSCKLCNYISTHYGSNQLNSMLQNKLVIEDMEQPAVFANEAAMKKALMSYNDQKDWENDRKSYNRTKKEVHTVLSKISRLLWSHCDITLQNKMLADKDYQCMKYNNDGEMYQIITKISNDTAAV